jgi:hypothetical protein
VAQTRQLTGLRIREVAQCSLLRRSTDGFSIATRGWRDHRFLMSANQGSSVRRLTDTLKADLKVGAWFPAPRFHGDKLRGNDQDGRDAAWGGASRAFAPLEMPQG